MASHKLISLLEQVKTMLHNVDKSGPGTQQKPVQKNVASESAAKKKLRELYAKQASGRSDATKVQAHGAKPRK